MELISLLENVKVSGEQGKVYDIEKRLVNSCKISWS